MSILNSVSKQISVGLLTAGVLATGLASPLAAADIDVNKELQDFINKDKAALHNIYSQMKDKFHKGLKIKPNRWVPGVIYSTKQKDVLDFWRISKVTVGPGSFDAKTVRIMRPKPPYKIIAIQGLAMCPDTVFGDPDASVSQMVELIKTVTKSVSVSKTSSIRTGFEVSVAVKLGWEAPSLTGGPAKEVTVGTKVNHDRTTSNSNEVSKSDTTTVRERVTVTLKGIGGKWAFLKARKHKENNIPYTATFTPKPDSEITIEMRHKQQASFHHDKDWDGYVIRLNPGTNMANTGTSRMNDKITSIYLHPGNSATVYEHKHYKGKSHTFRGKVFKLGWWDDRISSLKVHGVQTQKIKFSTFKKLLPARLQSFKVSGKIDMDLTQGHETFYGAAPMSRVEFDEFCAMAGGGTSLIKTKSKRIKGGNKGGKTVQLKQASLSRKKMKALWKSAVKGQSRKLDEPKLISLPQNGNFSIQVKHDGKCLDKTNSKVNGAQAQQWTCDPKNIHQKFKAVTKWQKWANLVSTHTGKCVDVAKASKSDHGKVQQWTCHKGANQLWGLVKRKDGWFSVVNKNSGKCLDVAKASKTDGSIFHQYKCHKGDNQAFKIIQ